MSQLELFTSCRPKVHNIDVPFEWMSIEYVLSLASMDSEGMTLGSDAELQDCKRECPSYDDLMADILENGFFDPIGVMKGSPYSDDADYLTNGHHRTMVCWDLGYEEIPITRCYRTAWRDSRDTSEYYKP